MKWTNFVAAAAALLALHLGAARAAPPVAEVENQPSVLHGVTVPDPYRWMEDVKSPRAQAWMQAQGDATRALLDRIEGREQIAARMAELSRGRGDVLRDLLRMPGDRLYYLKRGAGENQYKLVMRQGLGGPERVLVDPAAETARTGQPHAINHFKPSWDGRYLAYGLSAGGSEDADLRVLDIASGKAVATPLPRVPTAVHWLPDSRGLLFNQLKELAPGEPQTEFFMDSRVFLWRPAVGAAPLPVFGRTVTPALGLERLDVAELITAPSSRWVVARTTDTTVPEGKLFVAPVAALGRPGIRWRAIGEPADKMQEVALKAERLFVLTHAGAPRKRVVAVDLKRGTLKTAAEVAAEPASGVLEWMQLTRGGLVVGHRTGTTIQPRRHAAGDRAGQLVALPGPGAARPTDAPAADHDDLILRYATWSDTDRHLRLQGTRTAELALRSEAPAPLALKLQASDVEFASHDGVKVPMTVLHRAGLPLDGRNPVLVIGYASYGFSMTAGFWPGNISWMERGGVIALVNARGSGVHGEAWHRAGFKQTKRNTWLDGVAAARWLIAQGYGSAATMTALGGSAGGIFVGRATTSAPELFAAAVYSVGVLDAVRSEESANGITNISEFGSVKNAGEFAALVEMSTYHAIRDGTAYPGVLLVHGMNDPRVDVWHSAKTAARLQAASSSGRPALLRLDLQAGHGVGSTVSQRDAEEADIQAFLLWQTGKLKLRD
ncbi:S9 family peptidase [Rubrivivax sp. A210]|uniref:prolyl oligopeptidase family serine peptidase n=1 Tax=Rubrivivax sp. A210 TaxID=2772301 RepID=UPI00191949B4|nr:prolyl oligopeptidase family serine peptidase [Rubrivivax sp. A210]CAD5371701.1 S9 family peptidase [Rubrivivax sp. A210]